MPNDRPLKRFYLYAELLALAGKMESLMAPMIKFPVVSF